MKPSLSVRKLIVVLVIALVLLLAIPTPSYALCYFQLWAICNAGCASQAGYCHHVTCSSAGRDTCEGLCDIQEEWCVSGCNQDYCMGIPEV